MAEFDKADIEKLIDGVLPWPATQDMLKSSKDTDRFDKYVEIMQSRVDFNDPIYIKMEKLEIIYRLADEKNMDYVLLELKKYTNEVDVDFVRKSLRTIG